MSRRKEPVIPAELLDQLFAGTDAAAALDQGGLLDSLKKPLAERALNAEMDYHLGSGEQGGNNRNGYGRKAVLTDTGKIEIDVPRDRIGSFDPQLIAKYHRRFPGFDGSAATNDPGDQWASDIDVRTRHEHTGDHRAFERALWHRRIARSDIDRDRCRAGRGRHLAAAPARSGLSAGVLRRHSREDPRRRHGA